MVDLFLLILFLTDFLSFCNQKWQKQSITWFGKDENQAYTPIGLSVKNLVDGFDGAAYKSFPSLSEAEHAYTSGSIHTTAAISLKTSFLTPSISVDAACSGNPGVMEYQGVDTHTKEILFHKQFPLGTNNIGEFLAIVHGLAFLKKKNSEIPIYSDSVNALLWVKKKACKTTLIRNKDTHELYETIVRAEEWLKNNSWKNQLLKWETERWGEIPADFGRK